MLLKFSFSKQQGAVYLNINSTTPLLIFSKTNNYQNHILFIEGPIMQAHKQNKHKLIIFCIKHHFSSKKTFKPSTRLCISKKKINFVKILQRGSFSDCRNV